MLMPISMYLWKGTSVYLEEPIDGRMSDERQDDDGGKDMFVRRKSCRYEKDCYNDYNTA
jgi:hypothetical protein